MDVINITGNSADLQFIYRGNASGEVEFGGDYVIESLSEKKLKEIPVIVPGIYLADDEVNHGCLLNEPVIWHINWEWLYGKLENGCYRIKKKVYVFRGENDFDEYVIYCYFNI